MKRFLTALFVAGVVVASAGGATPERILAVEWQAGGGQLRWVSATTLRPVGNAVVDVGGAPVNVTAVSPDGALAALGGGAQGRVRFVGLERLRSPGVMWLGPNDWVATGLWPAPERLVLLSIGEPSAVVVVDPTTRRVVARHDLPRLVRAHAAT